MNDIDILKEMLSGETLSEALKKYESGVPAAYILGEWEFFGDRYILNEDCLIPRCDTERVVEKVIEYLPDNSVFADLCTGSGCIAISVLKRRQKAICTAVEISKKAVEAALKNAEINSVSSRIEIVNADIFDFALPQKSFDLIVSNPPYIPSKNIEDLDVYVKKEPVTALDGGEDGMDFYKHIIAHYSDALKSDGVFVFEIGYDQKTKIEALAAEYGFNCTVTKDYSGNPRVAVLKK